MAWRIVVQPNGKYARFSEVVDSFTDTDMSRDEAFELCRNIAGEQVAHGKILGAEKDRDRFGKAIDVIAMIHGAEEAEDIRQELSH